jgi:hypothetical protein
MNAACSGPIESDSFPIGKPNRSPVAAPHRKSNLALFRWLSATALLLFCTCFPAPSYSQDRPPEGDEAPARAEGEFTASTIFQVGYFDVRIGATPLLIDTRYYGVEIHDVGVAGLAWELKLRRLRVMPGIGWAAGKENKPAPVLTARWSFDHERWLTQGHWLQSFHEHVNDTGDEDAESGGTNTHSVVLEGHLSGVVGRFEGGALGEHVRYREENEWKGGGRAAWRLGHGVKISTEVLAPHVEVRAGFAWEP